MKIGVQLYSIKNISETEGLAAALKKAKELGYDCVEFAGYFGLTPDEINALLKEYKLEVAGIHQGIDGLRNDFENTLEFAKAIGAYSLCVPWYNCETVDEWIKLANELNEYGKKFREAGILFGYHNHAHEFKEIDGKRPIDIILENTNAENVFFEMDTHHVVNGGCSPVEYAKKYADRIPVIHVKENKGGNDTTIGKGDIDFPAVFKNAGKIDYYVVENENHGTNLKEIEDSAAYLKSIL
jgi:sugar phosphate isomerase/epimerase